jgi:hypothetical protein
MNSSNDNLDLIFIDFDHVSNYLLYGFLPTWISLMVLTLDLEYMLFSRSHFDSANFRADLTA